MKKTVSSNMALHETGTNAKEHGGISVLSLTTSLEVDWMSTEARSFSAQN